MSSPWDLSGTRAVVTGAATGIGQALALALARAGASVATIDVADQAETSAALQALRVDSLAVTGDTGRRADVDALAERVVEAWGGIDVWVNNAARIQVRPFLELSDDDWHGLLATNLHGYFHGCQAAARQMAGQHDGGRIVNVSSAADILVVGEMSAYIAAKGAIVALTKTLAVELAPRRIAVNAVAPGATDTPLNRTAYTPAVRQAYAERIPLGHIASAEEVADAAVFLATPAARYVTGHELVVDGGLSINGTMGHGRA